MVKQVEHGFFLIIIALLFTGCASPVPPQIRSAPESAPSEAAVRLNVPQHMGSQVRWGGTIVMVENHPQRSWVEMVSRPLRRDGRPEEDGQSSGRFIAQYPGFLDPMVFTQGRVLTIVGTIVGEEERLIDQFSYRFPVIEIADYYLWPPLPQISPSRPPYWDDPWWPYSFYPRRYRYPYWW